MKAPPTDAELLEMRNVPAETAGLVLGVSGNVVRAALREGRLPCGIATRGPSGSWVYIIPPKALLRFRDEGCEPQRWLELRQLLKNVMAETLAEAKELTV